jgi:predicted permease
MSVLNVELRDAWRRLLSRPGQAVLTTLVLGGGLAAFLFTLLMLNGIVMAKPPYPNMERVVNVSFTREDNPRARVWIPIPETRALAERLTSFERVAAYTPSSVALRHQGAAARVVGLLVGPSFLDVLGTSPARGRGIAPSDDSAAAPLVAVITDALWKSQFQSDNGVLGRNIHIDGRPATIVGVMAPEFEFSGADVLLPARLDDPVNADESFMLLGLLASGRSVDDVGRQMAAFFADAEREGRAEVLKDLEPVSTPLLFWAINANTRFFIWFMTAAGLMVLLLAVSNAAQLLLAQSALRAGENATRAALGGSRARLALAAALDAGVVCVLALGVGLALAQIGGAWLDRALAAAEDALPPWMHLGIDWRMAGWAALTCAGVALLASSSAIWRTWRLPSQLILRGGGQVGIDTGRARLATVMTVVQVALAGALLLSAVMCVRMLATLSNVEWGTRADPERVLSTRVALPAGLDADATRRTAAAIVERLGREPGIESASAASIVAGDSIGRSSVQIEGIDWGEGATRVTNYGSVDHHYAGTLAFDIRSGRFFDSADVSENRAVAVIDARFAGELFGGADPLGRRVLVNANSPERRWVTIIGVTGELHLSNADDEAGPDLLVPLAPTQDRFFALTLATRGDSAAIAARLPALVTSVNPDAVTYATRTQARAREIGRFGISAITNIMGGLGLLGLGLAAAGLYGALALGVTQRTREIGLRRAVGAQALNLTYTVGRRGFWAVGIGLVLGFALGTPLASALAGRSESIALLDLWLFAGVALVVLASAALALLVPLRRALAIDPMRALRES